MRDRRVIVYLTESRIDVAVVSRGVCTYARRVAANLPDDPCEWCHDLRQLGGQVGEVVRELGCAGVAATVVYDSPTQASDIISSPVRSVAAARSAAELACLDALSYSAMASVIASDHIGRDSGTGDNTHVAVAAERDDVCAAIADMIEMAGLSLRSITPIDGALMTMLGSERLGSRTEFGGVLYIGEEHSYFLVGGNGTLRFHRRLSLGTTALRDSLTRAIRSDHTRADVTLTARQANEMLRTHGFPDRDAEVCEDPPLRGADVIPLLLPGLQRFMVEVRQSLRFGLTEQERANLSIMLAGPGATLPGLPEVIATELGDGVQAKPVDGIYDAATPACIGSDIRRIARDLAGLQRLSVLPGAIRRSRMVQTVRQCLWVGAAAALVIIGLDGFRYEKQLRDVQMHADAVTIEKGDREALRQTGQRLGEAIAAGRQIEQRIAAELDQRVLFAPLLHEVSSLVKAPVRVTSLTILPQSERMVGKISGIVLGVDGEQPDDSLLQSLVSAMEDSPLIEQVVLGNVMTGEMRKQASITFDLEFEAVGYSTGQEQWRQSIASNRDGGLQ